MPPVDVVRFQSRATREHERIQKNVRRPRVPAPDVFGQNARRHERQVRDAAEVERDRHLLRFAK